MKRTVIIAIDVDGTLRCNCTPTCDDPNQRIVDLANTLGTFKNVRLMIWSGGGQKYAETYMHRFGIQRAFAASKIDSSTWVYGKPTIAIDDIQSCTLGNINLIVREK